MVSGTSTIDLVVKDLIGDTDSGSDRYVNYVRLAKNFIKFEIRYRSNSFDKTADFLVSGANTLSLPADYYEYRLIYDKDGRSYGSGDIKVNKDKTVMTFTCRIVPSSITMTYVSNDFDIYAFEFNDVYVEAMKSYILWKSINRRSNITMAEKRQAMLDYEREMNLVRQKINTFKIADAERIANNLYPYISNIRL